MQIQNGDTATLQVCSHVSVQITVQLSGESRADNMTRPFPFGTILKLNLTCLLCYHGCKEKLLVGHFMNSVTNNCTFYYFYVSQRTVSFPLISTCDVCLTLVTNLNVIFSPANKEIRAEEVVT